MNPDDYKNYNRKRFFLFALVILFMLSNILVIYNIYQQGRLAPDDSAAATNGRLLVRLVSPSSLAGAANGSDFTVAVYTQNAPTAQVAGIILKYNPASVRAKEPTPISEISGLLAVNKTVNNSTGTMTVDVAAAAESGRTALPENTNLVLFTFTVHSNSVNSNISLGTGSELGSPSVLSTTDGLGSLAINFSGGGGTPTPPPAAVCGDGAVQTGEACDAGSNNGVACNPAYGLSCTYCSSSCQNVTLQGGRCGDGIRQQPNEQCDDGNTSNGDGCSSICLLETTTPSPSPGGGTETGGTGSSGTGGSGTGTGTGSGSEVGSGNTGSGSNGSGTGSSTGSGTSTGSGSGTGSGTGTSTGSSNTGSGGTSTGAESSSGLTADQSRAVLAGILIITVIGTVISIFFLIRTLLQKPINSNAANPFMLNT